ncbi:MAG: alpha-glucoside-specific PTS transporter subunit IIBC [Spirochaetota bacterium]|nr:alpha-glucoside-specific PTS transporter subunit IIBC [Spirochaetota bacterium]
MKEAMQQFGAAMFVPVLLFSFSGLVVGLTIVFKDQNIVGSIAHPDGFFYKILSIIEEGAWMVFRNMPLLFCLGIPIGLSKIAPERAVLATLATYLSFNYFISAILSIWGTNFGVDFSQDAGGISGLAMIAGIKTLDTSIFGGILIGALVTNIHNKYYEYRLPDYLGVFQGTTLVYMIGFFVTLPIAFLTVLIWPKVQMGINSMQTMLASSGAIGVWIYTFLERILIPTGLHHFIYGPFIFGPAVVPNGIEPTWFQNVHEFANSGLSLKEQFPGGGFSLHGNSKVFGSIGIALALYATAKPENKKKVLALLIPATLTAAVVGITEPLEFTFLFVAPILFLIHSLLAATLAMCLYMAGVVGNMGAGLLQFITANWLFTFRNHGELIIIQLVIGSIFVCIWFVVFRFIILKWNLKTPGREDDKKTIKLYTKQDVENKKKASSQLSFADQAIIFLDALGGAENIETVTNCATRLRVVVKNMLKVQELPAFQEGKAHGLMKKGNSIQVIVGLSVPQIRTQFEELLKK